MVNLLATMVNRYEVILDRDQIRVRDKVSGKIVYEGASKIVYEGDS